MMNESLDDIQGKLWENIEKTKQWKYMSPYARLDVFIDFHNANLHVFEEFERLVRNAVNRDLNRVGMDEIFGAARFWIKLKTRSDDFKLCNNYKGYYARLLIWVMELPETMIIVKPSSPAELITEKLQSSQLFVLPDNRLEWR
jgi:hypothetical protein